MINNTLYSHNVTDCGPKYSLLEIPRWEERHLPRYQLIANRDIRNRANKGELGGLVASPYNLSQDGDCWIDKGARAIDNSSVQDNAYVYGKAEIAGAAVLMDNAEASGYAIVEHGATVGGNAVVCEDCHIKGNATICEDALIFGRAVVGDSAQVLGSARVSGDAQIREFSTATAEAVIDGHNITGGSARIEGPLRDDQRCLLSGKARIDPDGEIHAAENEIWHIPDQQARFDYVYELDALRDTAWWKLAGNEEKSFGNSEQLAQRSTTSQVCGYKTAQGTPCRNKLKAGTSHCAAKHPAPRNN